MIKWLIVFLAKIIPSYQYRHVLVLPEFCIWMERKGKNHLGALVAMGGYEATL